MLQCVAMDMKRLGLYLARTLSYQRAEFSLLELPLSKVQVCDRRTCTRCIIKVTVFPCR